MAYRKLILLLLLNLSVTWTAYSQPKPDSTVILTNKQAQFFIQWHLRAKSLMTDTLLLNKQIRTLGWIIQLREGQIKNDSLIFIQKDRVADTYKASYDELYKKYNKGQKRLKFFKNTTVIFLSTTILLSGLFILVNK